MQTATATFAEVDILAELETRRSRAPDYEREHRAFGVLSAELAERPSNTLQKLVEMVIELCDADTAAISLLDGDVFRWEAVAGVLAVAPGGTMPRSDSPSAVCIDRNATQLMHLADRSFPALIAEPRFVETLLIPFYAHGTAIGAVWIVSHHLDRKFDREDERIVRSLSQFASASWQLWKASEAVAEHNRRKDDFIATLSHELRNPLAAIVTATALLQATPDAERTARAIKVIGRQTHHMWRLIDDLLDIARIDSGKLHLDRRTVDVRTIVLDTVEARRVEIEQRRHSLTLELGAEPILIDADPVRLAQMVSNLVDNAAKYTPENGRISVAVSSAADEVLVAVRDTGVGVPADRAESIFEPFTQLHESRNSAAGGLGLGLAIVRRLTELHGGTVNVASDGLGKGSCFTVRLPVRPLPARVLACA